MKIKKQGKIFLLIIQREKYNLFTELQNMRINKHKYRDWSL